AVVDVHEAARLLAVAPDVDFVLAGPLGLDDLAADGRRGLLTAARPGAVRPIDVMVTGHARGQPEVLFKVAAHALAEELLPSVAVLGQRRIGVGLLQRDHVWVPLLVAV